KNVVIYGLTPEGTNTQQEIEILLKEKTGVEIKIEESFFLNTKAAWSPYLIKLESKRSRNELLKKAYSLKGTGLGLAADRTRKGQQRSKLLNQKRLEALQNGKQARIKGDKLVVDEETFKLNANSELEKIPSATPREESLQ